MAALWDFYSQLDRWGEFLGPIIGGELFYHFGKDIPFLFTSVILFFVFLSNLKLKDKLFYHPPLDRNGRI